MSFFKVFVFILCSIQLSAQSWTKVNENQRQTTIKFIDGRAEVFIDGPSAMIVVIGSGKWPGQVSFSAANSGTMRMTHDIDIDPTNGWQAYLLLKQITEGYITLNAPGYNGIATLKSLYAPESKPDAYKEIAKIRKQQSTLRSRCEKPLVVDQSIWREGLPAPRNKPIMTVTKFCFVHHTETPNNDTDYLARVRNIYLYHTQVNGWDDIAYNYLIAPDGTIFEGRDGKGIIEDDNVMGAHLCAKNSNTFGISMIGSFTSQIPTDTSINSLSAVLSWKMGKEGLDPIERARHPINDPEGEYFYRLTAHRDACNTSCPGDKLYTQMASLRSEVRGKTIGCEPFVSIDPETGDPAPVISRSWTVYPNPVEDILKIKAPILPGIAPGTPVSYAILTSQGSIVQSGRIPVADSQWDISTYSAGLYILRIYMPGQAPITIRFNKK